MGSCMSTRSFYLCGSSQRRNSQSLNTSQEAPSSTETFNTNNNNNNITILHHIDHNPSNSEQQEDPLDPMSIFIASGYFTNTQLSLQGSQFVPPTGKNRKLKKDSIKSFKFERAVTEKQLQAKREEFWDTAPHFEGKIEIWTALRAAAEAYELKNYALAQVICDSANIILPKGMLNDCYDELGNRYQIPVYVLGKPVNMRVVRANNGSSDESQCSKSNRRSFRKFMKKNKMNDGEDDDYDTDDFNLDELTVQKKTKSSFLKNKLKLSKKVPKSAGSLIGATSFSFDNNTKKTTLKTKESEDEQDQPDTTFKLEEEEDQFQIKLRVSNLNYNDQDIIIKVSSSMTVRQLKSHLKELKGIEETEQRMFFGGKIMKDKHKLSDHKLRKNVIVQVIVRELTCLDSIMAQQEIV